MTQAERTAAIKAGMKRWWTRMRSVTENKPDPIEAAVKAANATPFKKRIGKASKEHFAYLREVQLIDAAQSHIWDGVTRQIRRHFRHCFRDKAWSGLFIEFAGKGYSTGYGDYSTCAYVTYTVSWRGMTFSRSFIPASMADVTAERYKLAGTLLAWDEE